MATFDKPNTMTGGQYPTWQQVTLHATTAAELAASPKPSTFDVSILVDSNGANAAGIYQWEPQSVAVVDNVNVIGHQDSGTQPGRWLLIMVGANPSGGGEMFAFETIQQQEAVPGPLTREIAYNAETDAHYIFVAGSALAVDNFTVLSVTGGVPGQWLLRDDEISLAPTNAAGEVARLTLAMNAVANSTLKARLKMRAGAWLLDQQCDVPGPLHVVWEPGVACSWSLGIGGGVCFKAVAITGGTTGALTSNITLGLNQFRDNALHAVGVDVRIGGTGGTNIHIGSRYTIKAITPGVPNIYTVERPIDFPFVIGDPVREVTANGKGIIFDCNGGTITGNGPDYFFQFQTTDSYVRDVTVINTANTGSAAFSIELSAVNTWFENCRADLTANNTAIAFFIECGENSGYRNCQSWGGIVGCKSYDGYNIVFEDCVCTEWSSLGIQLTCHPTQTAPGTINGIIRGGSFSSGQNIGVSFGYCTDCKAIGVASDYNVQGFNFGTTAAVCVRARSMACSTRGNTSGQYTNVVTATASGTKITNFSGIGMGAGRLIAAEVAFDECEETGCTVSTNFPMVIQVGIAAGSRVREVGGLISPAAAAGAQPLVQKAGSCILEFDKTLFAMTAAGQTAITDSTAGCVILRDIIMTQTAASLGYVSTAAGCTLRIVGRTDMGGIGTPTTIFAGSFINLGALVANGLGTAQDVTWPDLKLNERIEWGYTALGTVAAGTVPLVTYTPGTKFTFTFELNNTSTIWWKVT